MLQQEAIAKRLISLLALRMVSLIKGHTFLNKIPNENSDNKDYRRFCGNLKKYAKKEGEIKKILMKCFFSFHPILLH